MVRPLPVDIDEALFSMTKNRVQSVLFLLLILAVCGWILFDPLWLRLVAPAPVSLPVSRVVVTPDRIAPHQQDAFAGWASRGAALGRQASSLEGTRVDGAVTADSAGSLVVDLPLRRLFDHFLVTLGEESLDQIRARIAFYLQQHLPPTAAVQAWEVLNQYLHYKDMVASLPRHDGSYQGMLDSLTRQRELRDALLGPELATAFFHDEDQFAEYAIQHVSILRDPALSVRERQRRADALLANLPEDARNRIMAVARPLQVERQVESLRQQGGSESEVWAQREQQLGAAAADRLAELDQRRDQWQQRYSQYLKQRQAIEASALAASDKAEQVARLRAEQFSPAELKRVEALDRIGEQALSNP